MAAGSLDSHRMTQHYKARERKWAWTDAATGGEEGEENQTYRMEFPKGGTTECPVEGCTGRAGTRTAMRVHFWRRHVRDTVIILEEGNLPHPRCENCCLKLTLLMRSEERRIGGWTDAQGEEEGKSDMQGLWKGDGGGVARLPLHDSTRKGKGEEMGMDGRSHGRGRRGREAKVQDGVPQGGDNGVPS